MLFFIFATHLFWVWSTGRCKRQQGYCILIFAVVVAYAELWLLSMLNRAPDDLLGISEYMRSFWGTPKLENTLNYAAIILVWALVSYHGGRLIHQLLVRAGAFSEDE